MEPQQPPTQTPPQTTPSPAETPTPTPTPPASQPAPPSPITPSDGSGGMNKMLLWGGIGLVVLILIWFLFLR